MKRVPSVAWAALVFGAFYALLEYGMGPLTKLMTGNAAPLPSSLVLMYPGMTAAAILLYLSVREDRWREFVGPIAAFLWKPSYARMTVLAIAPLLAGVFAYARASAPPDPPADPPGIHFSLPNKYVSVENPLPWSEENIREGGIHYTRYCAMCHGDAQDGTGMFARAWQPKPANFRDSGTIAQLDENYLFWRIKEGGRGAPKGSIEYRSAMPAWDGVLTDDQIWKIILFEYTSAGVKPAKRK